MLLNEENIRQLVKEELTKAEVRSMINSRIDDILDGREFRKKVVNITADVIDEFLTNFWNRKNFWKSMIRR